MDPDPLVLVFALILVEIAFKNVPILDILVHIDCIVTNRLNQGHKVNGLYFLSLILTFQEPHALFNHHVDFVEILQNAFPNLWIVYEFSVQTDARERRVEVMRYRSQEPDPLCVFVEIGENDVVDCGFYILKL